ncbi:MAG: hypothetical protein Q8R60_14900 [Mycobacteriales bacterium]|nr:hypothetical protein [Mycobacteriales bacterium]
MNLGDGASSVGTPVALVSAKGAPGVTASALLLTVLLPGTVLVEADPAGGDLRCALTDPVTAPLRADLGLVSLLAAHRTASGPADRGLLAHAQALPGGLPLLVGPGSPAQADALTPSWPQLAATVRAHPGLVLLDLGRLPHSASWQLVDASVMTIVVTRPDVPAVAHTRDLLAGLRTRRARVGLLVIGSEREQHEVTAAVTGPGVSVGSGVGAGSAPLWVGRLPHDPEAAGQLLAGHWGRRLDRSPLLAAGRRVARDLHDTLLAARTVTPGSIATLPYPAEPAEAWGAEVRS